MSRPVAFVAACALLLVPAAFAAETTPRGICSATSADAGDPGAILSLGFGARTFGGVGDDRGRSIAATAGGGFVVGGRTDSLGAGGSDLWVLVFDSAGRLDSQFTVGLDSDDDGGLVEIAGHGEPVVAGEAEGELRLASTGDFQWRQIRGDADDAVHAIRRTPDEGVVLAGRTESFGAGTNGDVWVLKLEDPVAWYMAVEWQVALGTPDGMESSVAVQPTADGGFVVAGETTSFGAVNVDAWLVKLDAAGSAIVWQRTYGGADVDRSADLIETSDGHLVLAGTSYSFQVAGVSVDAWVVKLDASGGIVWQYAYGTAQDDYVGAIVETSDGGLVMVGSVKGPGVTDPSDAWIVKLDADGDIVWQKRFLGTATESESFADVAEVQEGSLVAVGRTESYGAGGSDLLLVAVDTNGNLPRCELLTDWIATRKATAVVPVDSWDTPQPTDAPEWIANFPGQDDAGIEREMCSPSALLQLPRSGQTVSFNARDDGDLRPGAMWPDPRFVDNLNGTVSDLLTGLTWLRDADCAGTIGWDPDGAGAGVMVWDEAVEFANDVNAGVHDIRDCESYTESFTDWRLANAFEMETLLNAGVADAAAWLETVGFVHVSDDPYGYWSSTVFGTWDRMVLRFDTGELLRGYWSTPRRAWPVRGGQANYPDPDYPADTPKTGQASSVLAGDDGDHRRGVLWPVPRFWDHGDGTVTDELTGLRWLKDANCFGWSSWADAFTTLADFNADPASFSCAEHVPSGLVWRLPNRKELLSLIEYLGPTAGLPQGHPFVNVEAYHAYWSSTTVAHRTDWAWQVLWPQAAASMYTKSVTNDAVWPVVDTSATAVGAGRVPDDALYSGTPLTVAKGAGGEIVLAWGPSCRPGDSDYFIYVGTIPEYERIDPLYCTTGGLTTKSFTTPASASDFYLVVPANGTVEGSYGLGAGGAERPRSWWPCVPSQNIAPCP